MELKLDNVGKRYPGKVWGLKDFSLTAGPGVLGLLGPNGAGKSTLMNIIATVSRPTTGKLLWNGTDILRYPDRLRSELGYLPQDFGVYPHLNAVEFLEYMGAIKGVDAVQARRRIDDLLDLVNLSAVRQRALGSYSGGMKQRLGIAQALLNDPRLLIVDEPTAGLDPEERVRFRNLIANLAGDRVIILSTHIVSDVAVTATEIALIDQGCLLTHAKPEKLLQAVEGRVWEWVIPGHELPQVKQKYPINVTTWRSDGVLVRLISGHNPGGGAQPAAPTLEEAYLFAVSDHRSRNASPA